MIKSSDPIIANVIAQAILGKFNDWSEPRIIEAVLERMISGHSTAKTEIERDIDNQLSSFHCIEQGWQYELLCFSMLRDVNAVSRGMMLNEIGLRSKEFVADFGGVVPTAVAEIGDKIFDLEAVLAVINPLPLTVSPSTLATKLADAYCQIIFIHPFPDGNGRTARLLVQIVMRKFGYRYFAIPKYRNDSEWRFALDQGEVGDQKPMTDYFVAKMVLKNE